MAWDQNSDILEAIRRISSFFLNLNFYDYLIYSLQKFLGPGARNGTHSKTPVSGSERTPEKSGAVQTLNLLPGQEAFLLTSSYPPLSSQPPEQNGAVPLQ